MPLQIYGDIKNRGLIRILYHQTQNEIYGAGDHTVPDLRTLWDNTNT